MLMWLQLEFPLYLIVIAIVFIIASHCTIYYSQLTEVCLCLPHCSFRTLHCFKCFILVSKSHLFAIWTQHRSGDRYNIWCKILNSFCASLLLLAVVALLNSVVLFTRPYQVSNLSITSNHCWMLTMVYLVGH